MNGKLISEKNRIVILFSIIFLSLILRIYHVGNKSLWYDELASLSNSGRNLIDIITSQIDPAHPPLYFAILHVFLYLGSSEFILRLPSVIFSVFSIPLVYILGKDFFNHRVGLLSAFLLAISPVVIARAQEARMYPLFVFLSLLSLFFFYRAIRENDLKFWLGLTAANLFNIYTHYFAFTIIFVEFLFLVLYFKKYRCFFLKYVLSTICVLLLFIPQLINFYHGFLYKMGEGSSWKWGLAPDYSFLPSILISYSSIKPPYEIATITMYQNVFDCSLDRWLAGIVLFIILSYGFFSSYRMYKEATILSLVWIITFILTAFLAAFKISMAEKYILPILPVYLILVSSGLVNLKQKHFNLFTILFLFILLFNSYYLYNNYNSDLTVEDWRAASTYIQENLYHNDRIVITPTYTILGFTYYGLDPEMIIDLDAYGLKEDSALKKIKEISSIEQRLWIPYMPGFTLISSDPNNVLLRWLELNCTKEYETEGITIYLYEPKPKFLIQDPVFNQNPNSFRIHENATTMRRKVPDEEIIPFMILKNGWYRIEDWSGVPTHWMRSDASLLIRSQKNGTFYLVMNAKSFQRNRSLEIYPSNDPMASFEISPSTFTSVTFPIYLSKGSNIVRFHVPEGCERPCDIQELKNPDSRCLCLAVQNVSCIRDGMNPSK